MLLGLFFLFACGNSIWNNLTTAFGDAIAVTEPDLPSRTVYERSQRIAFSSGWAGFLYSVQTLFSIAVVGEIYLLLLMYDMQDLIHFEMNYVMVFGLAALTLFLYLCLGYLRFFVYNDALKVYYRKLPKHFKDRFQPPGA